MASKKVVKATILIAIFGGVVVAVYETFFWFTHVYENDARVETDLTQISSQVNGKIEKVFVSEGQSVKRGDSLVKLLDSDIRLTIVNCILQYFTFIVIFPSYVNITFVSIDRV